MAISAAKLYFAPEPPDKYWMETIEKHGSATIPASTGRGFNFDTDTFSYANELVWEYQFDPQTGNTTTRKNDPPPTYAHHCFVVARSARQFLLHAAFFPDREPLKATGYARIIRFITNRSAIRPSIPANRIAIPGFANLRQFSAAHADLLRQNCGGAWQSYVQRGNWRMVLPITRNHQVAMAAELQKGLGLGRLPIIHVVTFPRLTINHALMTFAASPVEGGVDFHCYDANICAHPLTLRYDSAARAFVFPRTHYFPGGKVNVYEIYCSLFL